VNAHGHLCPHCGYDLVTNGPILIDRWSMMGPSSPLFFEKTQISLSPFESELCYSLMKAYPRTVSRDNIIERLGSSAETDNIVSVWVTRIKGRVERAGAPIPLRCERGRGYRWMSDHEMISYSPKVKRLYPDHPSKRWHR
jgi:DNA-binding response OmpR family regulator